MTGFRTIESVAAPLPEADIDTDIIFPARFLLLLDKQGLGKYLFHERRKAGAGAGAGGAEGGFVLNRPPFDRAAILVAGPNFASGSSREQAVWALMDFGIRCVIAPTFGEIFFSNCFKNGLLPIRLEGEAHARIMAAAQSAEPITVDLEAQEVRLPYSTAIPFAIDPYRKRALLLGLDEIGGILADDADDIAVFEERQREVAPWLHLTRSQLAFFDDLEGEAALEDTVRG